MQRYPQKMMRKILLTTLDIGLLTLGFILAAAMWSGAKTYIAAYLGVALGVSLSSCAMIYLHGLYANWMTKSGIELLSSVVVSVTGPNIVASGVSAFAEYTQQMPSAVFLLAIPTQVVLLLIWRNAVRRLYKLTSGTRRVLVVAETETAAALLSQKLANIKEDYQTIATYLPGSSRALAACVEEADTLFVCADVMFKEEVMALCVEQQKEIFFVPGMLEMLLFRGRAVDLDNALVFSCDGHFMSRTQAFFKRVFDIVASAALLALVSPVMLLLFGLIPLTSRGRAIYRQERLGRDEQPYMMFKFRTMVTDAESACGPVLARKNDPRITPLGSFLRKTRLDELPQLFNVLMGDMSLVGPRPERAHFAHRFAEEVPYYNFRMKVKPGITGLAQVKGSYSISVQDKLRFDLMYLINYSFVLDLSILFQTIPVVLRPERAAGVEVMEGEASDVLPDPMPEMAMAAVARRQEAEVAVETR